MTSRRKQLLVAGALVAAGLAIGLPLVLADEEHSPASRPEQPAATTPPGAQGSKAAERAFGRFSARCLAGNPQSGCSYAAAVLLGRLQQAEERASVRASNVERICSRAYPPARCSQKGEILSNLSALGRTLRGFATKVRDAYDVTPIFQPGPEQGGGGGPRTTLKGSVVTTDRTWVCNRPVQLDSVRVTITPDAPRHQGVGIRLDAGCTGTIESIQVSTAIGDGVDVHAASDLTIKGGSITCNGHGAEAHQDGVQATSGSNVVFRHVTIDCPTANNSGFFVNAIPGRPVVPHRILFLNGRIGPTMSSTVFIARHQTDSGVANSVLCPSRYSTFRTGPGARAVNRGNSFPATC